MNARLLFSSIGCLLLLAPNLFGDERSAKPVKETVRADDGLNIVCEVRGKGDTALVFLHGWCGDRTWWKHQVDAFAGDYRVVAFDQAGHGESGKDRKNWDVAGLAADVESIVKKLGLKRVILVGHSMGGPVSLAAAKRLPGTVVAVIGVDTLHNVEFKWPEEQTKQILAAFESDFKGTVRMSFKGMLPEKADPELVKSLIARAESQDPKMAIGLMQSMTRLDVKALMKDAKVPVRCINAAGGFQFATPTAADVNNKYGDFKALIMEGVGHFPMLEKPTEFNDKLREVLMEFRGPTRE
ncbi:MAG: alpha/beta fold hydrolase [Gemmataceae bacterium]